ncbi:high-affinity nickel-transport protein-domain-containing protein [Coniella lustricola]|uniref:Nickel/cobalt efflux system n=1 Tax=Coniella lustricola TaxID=2025994 RepID=A0A2T3A5A2_9PEZI|nr:high-affinity nickel-transport protein-domain-containing protein [Coniella lustricola]
MARFTKAVAGFTLPLPPILRALPRAVTWQIVALIATNLVIWAAIGVVLRFFPALISSAVLSYTLGLRHALDADHISAIDLMTRRLIASGQRPVSVGTWFSLGHSTIVIVTCVVVAATSGALRDRFDGFQRVGNIVGTSVSAAFLLILCAGNAWVLYTLVARLRQLLHEQRQRQQRETRHGAGDDDEAAADAADETAAAQLSLEGAGFLANVFRSLFRLVDRPWKMYPLGVMFGLGFDTSSEIAVLGIASVQGASGTSLWLILIFPLLFTAGMCLIDTTDGALMMALYTSKSFARDHIAILYYSVVLTGITIVVSAFIGIIQLLTLVLNVAEPTGSFWDGVEAIGDSFEIIGGSICGLFLVVGLGSVLVYKPWRRRMDQTSVAPPVNTLEPPAEYVESGMERPSCA